MKSNLVSGAELARICGISRQAVSAATKDGRLYREELTQKYDLTHSTNSAFYELSTVQNTEAAGDPIKADMPEDLKSMAAAKLAAEVRRVEAAADKLELANAEQKKELIPAEMLGVFMGAYAAANRDFFFPLGKALSKGDPELQERIDKAVFKACHKTREAAVNAVDDYANVYKAMKEAENA